jgi:hypothetical protein
MTIKHYIIIAILFLAYSVAIFFWGRASVNPPQIATGGILQNRDSIEYEVAMSDTVIKWYEKIVYKQSEPKVIYIQKVDSAFIEVMKDYDLITKVIKKRNGDMTLFIYNQNGKELKRMEFENVGQSFQITSQKNNVFVKSDLWNWNGLYFKSQLKVPLNNNYLKETYLENGLFTGINFNNIIDLNIGISYNKLENIKGILETKIKIKR